MKSATKALFTSSILFSTFVTAAANIAPAQILPPIISPQFVYYSPFENERILPNRGDLFYSDSGNLSYYQGNDYASPTKGLKWFNINDDNSNHGVLSDLPNTYNLQPNYGYGLSSPFTDVDINKTNDTGCAVGVAHNLNRYNMVAFPIYSGIPTSTPLIYNTAPVIHNDNGRLVPQSAKSPIITYSPDGTKAALVYSLNKWPKAQVVYQLTDISPETPCPFFSELGSDASPTPVSEKKNANSYFVTFESKLLNNGTLVSLVQERKRVRDENNRYKTIFQLFITISKPNEITPIIHTIETNIPNRYQIRDAYLTAHDNGFVVSYSHLPNTTTVGQINLEFWNFSENNELSLTQKNTFSTKPKFTCNYGDLVTINGNPTISERIKIDTNRYGKTVFASLSQDYMNGLNLRKFDQYGNQLGESFERTRVLEEGETFCRMGANGAATYSYEYIPDISINNNDDIRIISSRIQKREDSYYGFDSMHYSVFAK